MWVLDVVHGIVFKAKFTMLLDKFAATAQGTKRECTVTSQTETHAKIKHDDEMQASYPEVLAHFKLSDPDPEVNDLELCKYVRMKYCRRVGLPKKERAVAEDLKMHPGLIFKNVPGVVVVSLHALLGLSYATL